MSRLVSLLLPVSLHTLIKSQSQFLGKYVGLIRVELRVTGCSIAWTGDDEDDGAGDKS